MQETKKPRAKKANSSESPAQPAPAPAPAQPSPQVMALQSAVNGLQNSIDSLSIVIVNLQTASPQIFEATCTALKETIGDLYVTRKLADARLPKEAPSG